MSDLFADWAAGTELAGADAAKLLGAEAGEPEREALIRFLAGRDERPGRGAFASLTAEPGESKK